MTTACLAHSTCQVLATGKAGTSTTYGPFKSAVDLATAAVAAALAFIGMVVPRNGRLVPMGGGLARWLAVIPVAVGLLLLGPAAKPALILVAVAGALIFVGCGLRYAGLVRALTFTIDKPLNAKGRSRSTCMVTGTLAAAPQQKLNQDHSLVDIVKDCGYNPDLVWTPESRGRNTHRLERWYLFALLCGALALAAAGMAFLPMTHHSHDLNESSSLAHMSCRLPQLR